ncbi:hypothetical protein DFQ27_003690 [Actinomortierella ambigua]|uniref:F-box/LRR-repeat protein 15/At3g58940/PEG3-like LRR domain-containing protein n=1 Tax=Actinomortierella ambigua TaxID=1343610 RepID=A0A9P6U5K4_9FUNG|nr:hypothetical protein DFQ27_003690 [Actinomortierella ambigua]
MPLLWNTITGKNGLSPKLTIESLRQYGHLIRTAADISHDRLVQKFYCGQVRHLTELCVDMEHIRQAMVLDAVDSRLWPPEAMDDDGFSTPVLQLINNTDMEDNPHHANHEDIDSLALDDPVSSHHLGQTNSLGQLLRTANYCIDIARRNPSLTRLEWAGLDTDLLWILNTDVYSRLPNLRMLYLKRWQVSQESFEWILQCCPQLEMLVLDHVQCFGVFSDSECYYRHHGLRQMVVYEHAYPFLRHFPDLERLTVNVTDGLNTLQLSDDIRQYCLRMKELEIDGSDPTMNRDIALLIEAVPQLMTLNLYCWFWSSSVVQALLKYHRYTIEVVNASDGAMDREGNLYLNHTLGDEGSSTAATTTMMAAEQDEIQLLLTYCRRLRVFKVPWHGLSTSGVTMQDLHNYGNSDSSYSTDVGQGRHLETLWILIKGMDAALEIQQLMTDLGARLTTAKQRAWIAELERSRELARQELRVSKGAHKDKQVDPYEGGSWDLGQSNDEVDMDVVALPTLPLLPSSRSASPLIDWVLVPRGIELAQEADTDGGYDVSALDKRMGDDEEEEQEDEDEEPGSQLEYPGMGPTYTEMVSRPSSHYERLGALLRARRLTETWRTFDLTPFYLADAEARRAAAGAGGDAGAGGASGAIARSAGPSSRAPRGWMDDSRTGRLGSRFDSYSNDHDPGAMPSDALLDEFRQHAHLIRRLKTTYVWPFLDDLPRYLCPKLERLHVVLELPQPQHPLNWWEVEEEIEGEEISDGEGDNNEEEESEEIENEAQVEEEEGVTPDMTATRTQEMLDQVMASVAQMRSLQYLFVANRFSQGEVRWPSTAGAVTCGSAEKTLMEPPSPSLHLYQLTSVSIGGAKAPTFVDTLVANSPKLRKLFLYGPLHATVLSPAVAESSGLEQLEVCCGSNAWHVLAWATRLPRLTNLAVTLKALEPSSALPFGFPSLQRLKIANHATHIDNDENNNNDNNNNNNNPIPGMGWVGEGRPAAVTRLLEASPVGILEDLTIEGDILRAADWEIVLSHCRASLSSLEHLHLWSIQGYSAFVQQVLEEGHVLRTLRTRCILSGADVATSLQDQDDYEDGDDDEDEDGSKDQDQGQDLDQKHKADQQSEDQHENQAQQQQPWACARTLETFHVPVAYPRDADHSRMRAVLRQIGTCTKLRHLWTTSMGMQRQWCVTAMLNISLEAQLVQCLAPLRHLETLQLSWFDVSLAEKLSADDAEWLAAQFPALREICGLQLYFCREFERRIVQLRPGFKFSL